MARTTIKITRTVVPAEEEAMTIHGTSHTRNQADPRLKYNQFIGKLTRRINKIDSEDQ